MEGEVSNQSSEPNASPPAPAATGQSSGMTKKTKKILLIVGIVAVGVFLIYYFFFGFTKEQKYNNCLRRCDITSNNNSLNLLFCKASCVEKYNKTGDLIKEINTIQPKSTSTTKSSNKSLNVDKSAKYDCNYIWPQVIINQKTQEEVKACTYSQPWCKPADNTYKNVACCANYSELTKEKTDCTTLPDLLDQ